MRLFVFESSLHGICDIFGLQTIDVEGHNACWLLQREGREDAHRRLGGARTAKKSCCFIAFVYACARPGDKLEIRLKGEAHVFPHLPSRRFSPLSCGIPTPSPRPPIHLHLPLIWDCADGDSGERWYWCEPCQHHGILISEAHGLAPWICCEITSNNEVELYCLCSTLIRGLQTSRECLNTMQHFFVET